MQFDESKKQYVKCNIILKLKQASLLIIYFFAIVILGIFYAIVSFNSGIYLFVLFALAMLIYLLISLYNVKESAKKSWEKVFGQATDFKILLELIDDRIIIKREDLENEKIQTLSAIKSVEKFMSTLVIVFSDNTLLTLSNCAHTNNLDNLLAIEQVSSKKTDSLKLYISKISIQLSICAFFLAFGISFILSDAFTLGISAWVQYSYCMYFFSVIPISFLIAGIIMRNNRAIGVTTVAVILIALFGSFRFYFNSQINYDTSLVANLEQQLQYDLPQADRLITYGELHYTVSKGKLDDERATKFEREIHGDDVWLNNLNLQGSDEVMRLVNSQLKDCDYYLIYNKNLMRHYKDRDVIVSLNECVIMGYRSTTRTFLIIYDINV